MPDKLFSPLLLETKRGSVTDEGRFVAYASTFGPPADLVGDIIEKGAFKQALELHKRGDTMPALLWHHDIHEPIGKWLSLTEDAHGLLGEGKLTLGTRRGREALALLKDDALATSIGFSVSQSGTEVKGDIRHIKSVTRLHEVSLVSLPANPRAKIKQHPENIRDLEKILRDVGFSHRASKRISSAGWSGLAREERSELDQVMTKIEQLQISIEELRNAK